MLQHTLDRADRLARPERKATVIARSHEPHARPQFGQRESGIIIRQPANRDTAAGIFLPLAYVRARDPQATVVIYPSDHFMCPEDAFMDVVRSAVCAVQRQFAHKLILVGVRPDSPEREYGWISPGMLLGKVDDRPIRAVESFQEKPGLSDALAAMDSGGLWNTLVLAARADLLWDLGWARLPGMMRLFDQLVAAIGTRAENETLEYLYRHVPHGNFSADLLAHASARTAVIEAEGVVWSDWGQPHRIAETLLRLGKQPAFPLECIAEPAAVHAEFAAAGR
jgi:mannose-1-phosphate guanylyltransferase